MPVPRTAIWMLAQEARALLTRLERVRPFALQETMVPAAALSPAGQFAIDDYLIRGRRHLHALVKEFLRWLRSPQVMWVDAEEAQRRFTVLRLRFNTVLMQFDLFQNVIAQRSERSYAWIQTIWGGGMRGGFQRGASRASWSSTVRKTATSSHVRRNRQESLALPASLVGNGRGRGVLAVGCRHSGLPGAISGSMGAAKRDHRTAHASRRTDFSGSTTIAGDRNARQRHDCCYTVSM